MTNFFNDHPIKDVSDDNYGVAPFADSLAKSIAEIKQPLGTTIALNGSWGSGKSSTVNLIRTRLSTINDQTIVVSEFKCWWYDGEEALALAFLQHLNSVLCNTLGKRIKNMVPRLARNLLQVGQIIGSAAVATSTGALSIPFKATSDFTKQFFPNTDTLETTFNKLSKALANQDKRFLIIIDDIDRLGAKEALAVFRLIKSVGQLPNVLYLLAFDRTLVDRAVNEFYPSEGSYFLEKIVQASFELPPPLRADLSASVSKAICEICGSDDYLYQKRFFQNNAYDIIIPNFSHNFSERHKSYFFDIQSMSNHCKAEVLSKQGLKKKRPPQFQAKTGRRGCEP